MGRRCISLTKEETDVFLLSIKKCNDLADEVKTHESYVTSLIKNYDAINTSDKKDHTLFEKLCEYYMCSRGTGLFLNDLKQHSKRYNEEESEDDYMITFEEGKTLQALVTATDVIRMELETYNISFTVH